MNTTQTKAEKIPAPKFHVLSLVDAYEIRIGSTVVGHAEYGWAACDAAKTLAEKTRRTVSVHFPTSRALLCEVTTNGVSFKADYTKLPYWAREMRAAKSKVRSTVIA